MKKEVRKISMYYSKMNVVCYMLSQIIIEIVCCLRFLFLNGVSSILGARSLFLLAPRNSDIRKEMGQMLTCKPEKLFPQSQTYIYTYMVMFKNVNIFKTTMETHFKTVFRFRYFSLKPTKRLSAI